MKPLNARKFFHGNRASQTFTTSLALLFACSLASNAQIVQLGNASGGNDKLDTTRSYTYNFGVTSAAQAGVLLNQVALNVGTNPQSVDGITIQVFRGFGGLAGPTNVLLSTETFASTTFSGNSANYTLNLAQSLSLGAGAYSMRLSSNAPSNRAYAFRDGLLSLAGSVTQAQWIQDSNTGGTAGTTITPSAGYVLADHSVSASSFNLGRFHASGSAPTSVLTLENSAPVTSNNATESLVVSQGTLTGAATLTALTGSQLAQGASQGVTVGLTAAVGARTGSVQLNFNSTQTGSSSARVGGNVSVGDRTISLSGFGYSGKSEWTADSGGSWNLTDFDKWATNGGTPGMDGTVSQEDTALFGSAATANRTIALNGSNTALQTLTFNNSAASYTLSQGSGGAITLGSAGREGALTNSAGAHTLSAPLVLGNKLTVNSAANTTIRLEGAVSGSHGLVKSGAGRLAIEGTTTYSGLTDVQEGTFVVNGSTAGALTVGSNARLEGSGTIGGNTTISGTHSPGNSPDIQTFGNDLSYTNGSIIWELIGNTIADRGTNYDGIDVEGNLAFSGSTTLDLAFAIAESNIDFTNEFWSSSYLGTNGWKIFDVTGDITGFENLTLTGSLTDSEGAALTTIRPNAAFSLFEDANGIYLNYNVVPEPSTVILLSIASLCLFKRRRG